MANIPLEPYICWKRIWKGNAALQKLLKSWARVVTDCPELLTPDNGVRSQLPELTCSRLLKGDRGSEREPLNKLWHCQALCNIPLLQSTTKALQFHCRTRWGWGERKKQRSEKRVLWKWTQFSEVVQRKWKARTLINVFQLHTHTHTHTDQVYFPVTPRDAIQPAPPAPSIASLSLSSCSGNVPRAVLQTIAAQLKMEMKQPPSPSHPGLAEDFGCRDRFKILDSKKLCHLAQDDEPTHYFKVIFVLKHSYQFLWQLIVGHRFLIQETS